MTQMEDNQIRQLYTMDNLPVLRCADSETGDLIYPVPPFNFGTLMKGTNALAPFKDTWTLSDTRADEETLPATNYPRVKDAINIRIRS